MSLFGRPGPESRYKSESENDSPNDGAAQSLSGSYDGDDARHDQSVKTKSPRLSVGTEDFQSAKGLGFAYYLESGTNTTFIGVDDMSLDLDSFMEDVEDD